MRAPDSTCDYYTTDTRVERRSLTRVSFLFSRILEHLLSAKNHRSSLYNQGFLSERRSNRSLENSLARRRRVCERRRRLLRSTSVSRDDIARRTWIARVMNWHTRGRAAPSPRDPYFTLNRRLSRARETWRRTNFLSLTRETRLTALGNEKSYSALCSPFTRRSRTSFEFRWSLAGSRDETYRRPFTASLFLPSSRAVTRTQQSDHTKTVIGVMCDRTAIAEIARSHSFARNINAFGGSPAPVHPPASRDNTHRRCEFYFQSLWYRLSRGSAAHVRSPREARWGWAWRDTGPTGGDPARVRADAGAVVRALDKPAALACSAAERRRRRPCEPEWSHPAALDARDLAPAQRGIRAIPDNNDILSDCT